MPNGDGFTDKRFSVLSVILAAILSTGGASVGSSYWRVDKFGRSEFEKEKQMLLDQMQAEIEQRLSTHKIQEEYERELLEGKIRKDMPPPEWRRSVTQIERFLSRKYNYEPYER